MPDNNDDLSISKNQLPEFNPLNPQVESEWLSLDVKLENQKKIAIHKRSEFDETYRQRLLLGLYTVVIATMIISIPGSAYLLFMQNPHEASIKVLEIFGVGTIAGIIGFVFTKTFEK